MEPAQRRAALRDERMNRGLSLAAAASAIGIHRATLVTFERDESVSLPSLKAIADFYGCKVVDLVDRSATDLDEAA